MKKVGVVAAAIVLSGSMYAGYGSGCFNNCQGPQARPGTCTVEGVAPDVREYRANPNQGIYSTGEGYPSSFGYGQGDGRPGAQLKQGPWQNNNPQARSREYDRQLYNEIANDLRGQNLSITVYGGVVTLQGRVGSEDEKKAIGNRVNSNPRVKRLNNQLEVWNQNTNPWNQQR